MVNIEKLNKSTFIPLVTIFAAFTIVCDYLVVTPFLPYSGFGTVEFLYPNQLQE